MSIIDEILLRSPINRMARVVTSQAGCQDADSPLTREDLVAIKDRLERKHRLLKHVLGIKTKAQHANARYKARKRLQQFRQRAEPRAFQEYIRVGDELLRVVGELTVLRRLRQVGAMIAGDREVDQSIIESVKRELLTRAQSESAR